MDRLVACLYAAGISEILCDEEDLESSLKELGKQMGRHLIVTCGFRRETSSVESLLFKMVYMDLPEVVEVKRSLEKSTADDDSYIIREDSPFFAKYISLSADIVEFTGDDLFSGIMESILAASGFSSSIVAYNTGNEKAPNQVTYLAKITGRLF